MLEKAPVKAGGAKPAAAQATATTPVAKTAAAKPAATQPAPRRTTSRKAAPGVAGIDLQALIRRCAYELWEQDGRPDGRDYAHWQQAEREIGGARAAT
jgi:hypothetical protein